jgi:hypothetical protein
MAYLRRFKVLSTGDAQQRPSSAARGGDDDDDDSSEDEHGQVSRCVGVVCRKR